jgi:hypothetical protein
MFRRATQMGAHADQHRDLRLDRTRARSARRPAAGRRSRRPGSRAANPARQVSSIALERLAMKIGWPRHLITRLLAVGQGADVLAHRRAGQLGAGAGVPRLDERHRGEPGPDRTHHGRGGGQEPARPGCPGFWTSSLAIRHSENLQMLASVGCLATRWRHAGRPQKTGKCNGTLNEPTIVCRPWPARRRERPPGRGSGRPATRPVPRSAGLAVGRHAAVLGHRALRRRCSRPRPGSGCR